MLVVGSMTGVLRMPSSRQPRAGGLQVGAPDGGPCRKLTDHSVLPLSAGRAPTCPQPLLLPLI